MYNRAERNNNVKIKEDRKMQENEVQAAGQLKDIGGVGAYENQRQIVGTPCGCGDDHRENKGIGGWGGFFLGILAAGVILAMIGKFGSHEPKQEQGLKADVAELRVKVAETAERIAADRKSIEKTLQETIIALQETRSMLVMLAGKTKGVEDAHGALVKDLQTVISQNNRALTVLDRVLRDKYGKEKWFGMVKDADTALAGEAAEYIKAEMKARELAEKAKIKQQEKAKTEPEQNKLTEKNTVGK